MREGKGTQVLKPLRWFKTDLNPNRLFKTVLLFQPGSPFLRTRVGALLLSRG